MSKNYKLINTIGSLQGRRFKSLNKHRAFKAKNMPILAEQELIKADVYTEIINELKAI